MKKVILIAIGLIGVLASNAQNIDSLKSVVAQEILSLKNGLSTQLTYTEKDCMGAIPICGDSFSTTIIYRGIDSPNEINVTTSCLSLGEYNGAWYKVYITQPGQLGFNIVPNDSLDDYDWALFNLTNANCDDIYNVGSLEVACNFSGMAGITGANRDSLAYGNDAPKIHVQLNQVYYLYVSFFMDTGVSPSDSNSLNQSGYIIDFSISSCSIDSCLQQVITAIDEKYTKVDAQIYPNPASQNINLVISNLNPNESYTLAIYNSAGALVKEQANNNNRPQTTLDVSALTTGLYTYRVVTTTGKTTAGRFVKE